MDRNWASEEEIPSLDWCLKENQLLVVQKLFQWECRDPNWILKHSLSFHDCFKLCQKNSSLRKIKLSKRILVTVAVVARAEQRGPSVKRTDRWPMVIRAGTSWQNWRLVRRMGADSYTRLALIAYCRVSPSVKESPEAPGGSKQFWLSPARCHTSNDTRLVDERENHPHQMGKHCATCPPDKKDDRRIWGAQINGGDASRWLTRFDKSKSKMTRDLNFDVDDELENDSCSWAILKKKDLTVIQVWFREFDTQFVSKQVATSLRGITQWWWRRAEEFEWTEERKLEC